MSFRHLQTIKSVRLLQINVLIQDDLFQTLVWHDNSMADIFRDTVKLSYE